MFHLAAVGRKFSYDIDSARKLQTALLDEIETSFRSGIVPALNEDQLIRYWMYLRGLPLR
jgi:hypothetical protein